MKTFVAILLFGIWLYTAGEVIADEARKECTYIPKPSDQVYYTCGQEAIGTVEIKLWICGERYTIDVKCPK